MAFAPPTSGSYIVGAIVVVLGIIVPLTVMVSVQYRYIEKHADQLSI